MKKLLQHYKQTKNHETTIDLNVSENKPSFSRYNLLDRNTPLGFR